jgi:Holliday junction resolvase RusA-like endonuclease
MAAVDVITEVWVPGLPKTKGSLTFKGKEYVEENVKGSARWRRLVASAVRADLVRRHGVRPGLPPANHLTIPVGVRLQFWLPESAEPRADVTGLDRATRESASIGLGPIKSGSGDLDKLVRNVLDALTDAGAYRDDVQVVRVIADKMVRDGVTPSTPGVLILAWTMPPNQVLTDVGLARQVWQATSLGIVRA